LKIIPLALALLVTASVCGFGQASPSTTPAKPTPTPRPLIPPDPAALALALTALPKTPQPPAADWWGWQKIPNGVQTESGIVIGTGGGRPLHAEIAYPKNEPKTPMPAIIWIHGGAWQGDSEKPNKAAYFATQGYFTASIEYRLMKEALWPAQIQDCKLGVRWLRANAAKYNVDPNRIACWGASAGGHLASCLGTLDDPALEGDGGYPGVSSKVQAVVDWFGWVDFRDAQGPEGLFGVPYSKNPALHLSGSPYVHVKASEPPFLVIHGDLDTTVQYKQSVDFVAAMLTAGAPVEFIPVHGGVHGFGAPKGFPPPKMRVHEILSRMTEFLDKYLKN